MKKIYPFKNKPKLIIIYNIYMSYLSGYATKFKKLDKVSQKMIERSDILLSKNIVADISGTRNLIITITLTV